MVSFILAAELLKCNSLIIIICCFPVTLPYQPSIIFLSQLFMNHLPKQALTYDTRTTDLGQLCHRRFKLSFELLYCTTEYNQVLVYSIYNFS